MPKLKQITKCKHPNSRKTKALIKQTQRCTNSQKMKLSHSIKQNIIGEKLSWFQENLQPSTGTVCTLDEVEALIIKYLSRFNEELKQIAIKHGVGKRANRQHASREDVINMTIKRETTDFNTCGLEVPDLLNQSQVQLLREWNGELRFLPNFKLRRFSKNFIQTEKLKLSKHQSCK